MLIVLSIACYWLMAFEVVLVFWAIGEPISLWLGTIVETFTRSASVPGGAIPGNLGALEASNVAVVKALGAGGRRRPRVVPALSQPGVRHAWPRPLSA